MEGKSYDKVIEHDLLSLLKIMRAVTEAVSFYHDAGFLHLDLKPKNILVIDGVTEIVKLFDYDSLTEIEKLVAGQKVVIPRPETYYVPELSEFGAPIGIHTDVFEIGAMFFTKLFQRAPQRFEMMHDAEFFFEESPLLQDVSPEIIFEIEKLIRHTMQITYVNRYQNMDELKAQLDKLIALVQKGNAYLFDSRNWIPASRGFGRTQVLQEISNRLEKENYLFIKGFAGSGKSDTAKLFAERFQERLLR
jgi:serine/threonine protein kinase